MSTGISNADMKINSEHLDNPKIGGHHKGIGSKGALKSQKTNHGTLSKSFRQTHTLFRLSHNIRMAKLKATTLLKKGKQLKNVIVKSNWWLRFISWMLGLFGTKNTIRAVPGSGLRRKHA